MIFMIIKNHKTALQDIILRRLIFIAFTPPLALLNFKFLNHECVTFSNIKISLKRDFLQNRVERQRNL